jgi:hypothetical protein
MRSPDGRSPRGQLPPLLPLDLSSSDFEVDLLLKLVSTTSSTTAANANVVLTQHAQHTTLALESINLRVYLHGWQHLVECVQNYEDFKVQAVGRVAEASAGWTQLGAILSSEDKEAEQEEEAPLVLSEKQSQLRLKAHQLTIEAIAAAGSHPADEEHHEQHTARTTTARGTDNNNNNNNNNNNATTTSSSSSRIVPAGQIMLQLSAEIQKGPDGARFMVSLPAALLRVGPIHLDTIIDDLLPREYTTNLNSTYRSNNSLLVFGPGDALLGLKNAEITASSETFEFFETSSLGVAAGAGNEFSTSSGGGGGVGVGAPVRTRRSLDALAVSLQHVSVWAGQRNLCSAAALGQHVAYMVAEITELQTALASQQQQQQHSHHHNVSINVGATPLGSADGVIHDGRATGAASSDVINIYGNGNDGTAATATTATGGAGGSFAYEEHHTAINVDIESIAIALQCERLESDSANSAASTTTNSGTDATPAPAPTTAAAANTTASVEISPSPLFEFALSKISLQVTDRGDGGSSGTAMLQVGLDVFNGSKMAWESVIDPWGACLNFTLPHLATSTSTYSSSKVGVPMGAVAGNNAPYASPSPRGATATAGVSSGSTAGGAASSNGFSSSSSAAALARSRHMKLEVVSNQNFEATVTAAVTDAAAAAGAILSHIPAVVAEPDTLNEHILPDNSIAAAASLPVTFQLSNLTGADVDIWLEAPLPGGLLPARPPIGPATMCLSPSGRAVLPVLPLYQGVAWRSRRAGKPSFSQGVEFDKTTSGDDVLNSDEYGTVYNEEESTNSNSTNAISQRRTLLYFRFSGQQGPLSGPVYLDKPGAVSYAVHVGNPHEPQVASLLKAAAAAAGGPSSSSPSSLLSAAHVVAETAERRHGSFTAVLHSGVCITNTTPIDLDVGITEQTTNNTSSGNGASSRGGGGGEVLPMSLGVLLSGESTWLPAARAEMGLLHVRPTANYRPQIAERVPPLSARLLPPLPTRHPAAAATATTPIGLSSGVHPSSVPGSSSGVVYRSGAGNVTPNSSSTQTYSPAGTAYGTAAFTGTAEDGSGYLFKWSAGLSLSQLIKQQGGSSGAEEEGSSHGGISATIKQLSCAPSSSSSSTGGEYGYASPLLLSVGATLQGKYSNYILSLHLAKKKINAPAKVFYSLTSKFFFFFFFFLFLYRNVMECIVCTSIYTPQRSSSPCGHHYHS